jgi:hypothetical protein
MPIVSGFGGVTTPYTIGQGAVYGCAIGVAATGIGSVIAAGAATVIQQR